MTTMTTEEKIQKIDQQLMLLFTDDPGVDWKVLTDMTGGLIQKGAADGNGLDIAKAIARYNRRLLEVQAVTTPKRRGRKPKAEAVKAAEGATPVAKKRRGRPPKNAAAAATTPEVKPAE
jgi:hypothetical protein